MPESSLITSASQEYLQWHGFGKAAAAEAVWRPQAEGNRCADRKRLMLERVLMRSGKCESGDIGTKQTQQDTVPIHRCSAHLSTEPCRAQTHTNAQPNPNLNTEGQLTQLSHTGMLPLLNGCKP
jgi:hypothetical protein